MRAPAAWVVSQVPGVRVTSTYRSLAEQAELYRNRARNPYPVAPPGYSYHNYGRAFDVAGSAQQLGRLAYLWRAIGGTWDPSDPIHFQA